MELNKVYILTRIAYGNEQILYVYNDRDTAYSMIETLNEEYEMMEDVHLTIQEHTVRPTWKPTQVI